LEALTGEYEKGRHGHGEPTFKELLAATKRSVVHLEARDTYDATDPAFQKWLVDGDTSYGFDDWIELIGNAAKHGVRMRRLRIVSEPVSDYIRWEHAISYGNIQAGEDLRWLPRHLALICRYPSPITSCSISVLFAITTPAETGWTRTKWITSQISQDPSSGGHVRNGVERAIHTPTTVLVTVRWCSSIVIARLMSAIDGGPKTAKDDSCLHAD